MDQWSGVSQAYRDSFATLCCGTEHRILDDLTPGPLLDVGSGTGSLTAGAHRRGFTVTAVDADPDMVAMTNDALPGSCTLQALPRLSIGDGTFPAVAANFVVNHLPDPRAGVRELARVTAPAGRLAMTIWPAGGAGWGRLVSDIFDQADAVTTPSSHLPPEVDFPRTPEGLASLATQAGMQIQTATTLTWTWRVTPASLWAGISGGVATPGARYKAQTQAGRSRIADAFEALTQQHAHDGLLHFDCAAAYVLAAR